MAASRSLSGLAVSALVLGLMQAPAAQAAGDFASTHPAPRVEYWQHRQAAIDAALRDSASLAAVRLVFVGQPPENRALNIGISGDRSEHLLQSLAPAAEEPVADSVYEGVRAVLLRLHERQPGARIVPQSILSTSDPL